MARSNNFIGEPPIGFTTSNIMMQSDNYKQCGVGTMLKRSDYPELSEMYPYKFLNMASSNIQTFNVPKPVIQTDIGNMGNFYYFINNKFYSPSILKYKMFVSTNGLNWVSYNLPSTITGACVGVFYFNNNYILITSTGKTAISSDGINWVAGNDMSITSVNKYAISNNKIVVIPKNGTLAAYSTDGITWNTLTLNVTSTNWADIASDGSNFMMIPGTATNTNVYKSTDGLTWVAATIPSSTYAKLFYSNGNFIAITASAPALYITSNLGTSWTTKSIPYPATGTFNFITVIPGYIIATDSNSNCYFIDDTTYNEYYQSVINGTSYPTSGALAYGNGIAIWPAFSASNMAVSIFPAIEPDYIPLFGPNTNYIRVK